VIPAKIVRFLERANVAQAGTRDRQLVPCGHRVSGWHVGADGTTLTALIPEASRPHLLENLEDNGWFTMTAEDYPAHETYQFKGRYLGHRPADARDAETAARQRERFLRSVLPLFGDAAAGPVRAFTQPPAVAVEFRVLEIFVQTPGPGAGTRIMEAAS
jgi:hypothetical protein